jgi:type VI secretion system protein ImpC
MMPPHADAPAQRREAPLRVLVLTDLCSTRAGPEPYPLRAAEDLEALMRRLAPAVALDLANELGSSPAALDLRLDFTRLKDFAPRALVRQVPALDRLSRFIEGLEGLAGQRAHAPEQLDALLAELADLDRLGEVVRLCREAVGTPKGERRQVPASEERQQGQVGRILEMVDLPDQQERAASAIGSLVSAVGRRDDRGDQPSQIRRAVDLATRSFCLQLDRIYQHPSFQQLERLWRGLKFLVDSTDFRGDVELDLMHLPPGEALGRLDEALCQPILDGARPAPGLIIAPYQLDSVSVHVELMRQLAEAAEALQAPLVTSIGPAFLGLGQGREASTMRSPGALFEQPQYTKWNALRSKSCSRWLSVAFNRFLLRPPHTPREGSRGARYTEGARKSAHQLWGDPTWAAAALVVGSFTRYGWPTQLTGVEEGRIADLPIHDFMDGERKIGQIPVEAFLPKPLIEDLASAGIMALFTPLESDSAYLLRAPTVHQVSNKGGHLAYMLMTTRVVQHVEALMPQLRGLNSIEEIRRGLEQSLEALLANTGLGASTAVLVRPDPDRSDLLEAQLTLRTGRGVLRGAELELNFRLGGPTG